MKLKMEITETGVKIQRDTDGGDAQCKAVDVGDLQRAFAGDVIMDTGWLGPRIHRFSQVGGVVRVLVEEPPKRRKIKYESNRPVENVPTPRALFSFSLRNNQLTSSRACAVAEVTPPGCEWIPQDTTRLARWPLPNVFRDSRICWGRLTIPVLTIPTINVLVNMFFESTFNHDLQHEGLPQTWRGRTTPTGMELLRSLAREETFPMDLMVPMGNLNTWWQGGRHDDY